MSTADWVCPLFLRNIIYGSLLHIIESDKFDINSGNVYDRLYNLIDASTSNNW